ncbi:efflux RND transporter permease subunit [Candidatus Nitrospira nitrificans]|uniref:RND transporter, Hydrophobe/Amphiphile Efflux-1 (HAE1)/Heavy Metal Efflux (HME) family, permease protein n=1 Tax=Candidatus Nitrospira nitrificans TaxID=1742973 RepID=A0A0S4LHD3_9BACT|nr:efflux RND transporter permease subunit [Candidatus Nitrospira nitrificans]CUS36329.1 RND transporter, Hydrophobe/Amphiphile Efflux-1 (HAE1)/Heavy Metal Efflux (HME) family, permease protein [Candidatus Nitrospira nitrificans]
MNNLVQIALKRPYTFVVLAILILVFGAMAVVEAPTDVFPNIQLPVSSVVWLYDGLMPQETEGRVTRVFEQLLTSTVEGIKTIVSTSYFGHSIINIFLQDGVDLAGSEADIVAISQTAVKALPPDVAAPMVMRLFPSQVPVAVLQVESEVQTPAELYNLCIMRIRPMLVTIPGAILPHPYGGQDMQVMINVDQQKLLARHLTTEDVHQAIEKQNLVLPGGDMKIKETDWLVLTNASPLKIEEFDDIPIKRDGNSFIHLRDVATVRLAGRVQTNSVLVDGKQAVIVVVMKSSEASTLDIVDGIKKMLPRIQEVVPPDVKVSLLSDSSVFVRDAIADVVHEMVIAAALVGFIVLLMLGSWRPTVIVLTSIPLSILCSIIGLHLLGESINIMTLGGLALAVGILVDNAAVMIENIDTHLAMGKPLETSIIDAANQIILPTFVATLAITIVWVPLFHLSGIAGWVFPAMAEAVVFAMLASFILTYTLVPTMAKYILKAHHATESGGGAFARFQRGFQESFDRFRDRYAALLERVIAHRARFVMISMVFALGSLVLFYFNGREFFPQIKGGLLQMHMRAPLGLRIEAAGRVATLVSNDIREMLPGNVDTIVSNCGLPVGAHNLAFIPSPTIGTQDCDLTITLKDGQSPVWEYRNLLRKNLTKRYPGTEFTFQPADLTDKILNFGSLAPIDLQINGPDLYANYAYGQKLASKFRQIPGAADVYIYQTMFQPTILVEGNRRFALGLNLNQKDFGFNMLLATAGSQQIDQKYWLDRSTRQSYRLNVYTPQPQLTSVKDLMSIPVAPEVRDHEEGSDDAVHLLGNMTNLSLIGTPGVVTHRNLLPMIDVLVSAEGRDLGGVLADVRTIAASMKDELPRGSEVEIHGQSEVMHEAFIELGGGLLVAILLVYLLIVVNFQSWLDPFIIITALVGAFAGIAWSLFATHTNISVPALTGAIMTMGTATANSILLVAYARERLAVHGDALRAAIEAGKGRIRPVLMTAAAMIIGMLPMAMANSQNAPLGRAVMGGLAVATLFTLFFVPCIYAIIYNRRTVLQKECD